MSRVETPAPKCTYESCGRPVRKHPSGRCHDHRTGRSVTEDRARIRAERGVRRSEPSRRVEPGTLPPLSGVSEETKSPREYQREAVEAIATELETHDRASLRAACGMGKTVMAQMTMRQRYEEGEGNGVFLLLTTGIQLTQQCRSDFDADGVLGPHHAFSIHDGSPDLPPRSGRPTREDDVAAIAAFLATPSEYPKVVFSTYDSQDKIAEAQALLDEGDAVVDLVVNDESHRLGGVYDSRHAPEGDGGDEGAVTATGRVPRVFHDDVPGTVRATSRVFMSATPITPDEAEKYKPQTRVDLRRVAREEDAGRRTTVSLHHLDEEVFGRVVFSRGLPDAIREDALVPIEPVLAPVRVEVARSVREEDATVDVDGRAADPGSPGAMTLPTYATLASSLESLADGGGSNVLAFASRIEDANAVVTNWSSVALSLARSGLGRDLSADEARELLDSGGASVAETRAARLRLLADHARVVSASSESDADDRELAFTLHDGEKHCECGEPGRWCACARVVSNVDLFGQGINVRSIDTVVLGSKKKTNDVQITQAVGRVVRKNGREKEVGRVVIPTVTAVDGSHSRPIGSELTTKCLYGVSRLARDSIGAALTRTQMAGSSGLTVRTIGGGVRGIEEEVLVHAGDPIAAAALVHSYDAVERATSEAVNELAGSRTAWREKSPEEREREVVRHATAFAADSREKDLVSRLRPFGADVAAARRTLALLETRATSYDRANLTRTERGVAEALGYLDAQGVPGRGQKVRRGFLDTLAQRVTKKVFADALSAYGHYE